MYEIIGLVMIYSWIHSAIIIVKGGKRTEYENVVLIVALTGFVLFVLGTMM